MPTAGKQSVRCRRSVGALATHRDVVAVTAARISPSGKVAVMEAYPDSAPQAAATTNLVNTAEAAGVPTAQA